MVWSNAYSQTLSLWYEGSLVEVVGKVRLRDDEISIACDEARPYEIADGEEQGRSEEASAPGPEVQVPPPRTAHPFRPLPRLPRTVPPLRSPPQPPRTARRLRPPPRPRRTRHRLRPPPQLPRTGQPLRPPRTTYLYHLPSCGSRLEESSNPGQDEHKLREVVKLLMNYPGEGSVGLRIRTEGKTVIGELPFISVKYCPELHSDLAQMVGEGRYPGGGNRRAIGGASGRQWIGRSGPKPDGFPLDATLF